MAVIKKGEGSRGGHVVGHTKSGAPIYDSAGRRMLRSADVGANIGQALGTAGHLVAAVVKSDRSGKLVRLAAKSMSKTTAAGAVIGGAAAAAASFIGDGELTGPGLSDNPIGMAVVGYGGIKAAAPAAMGATKGVRASAKLAGATGARKVRLMGRGVKTTGNVTRLDFGTRNPFKKGK